MEGFLYMMESYRNLDTTKFYTKIQIVNGTVIEEEVGKFSREYTMGSGDGQQIFWEFIKEGKILTISDTIWEPTNGPIHFRESDVSKN